MIVEIYKITLITGISLLLLGLIIKKFRLLAFIGLGVSLYFPFQVLWAIFADLFLFPVLMLTVWQIWPPAGNTFDILFLWPPVIACVLTPFISAWLYLEHDKSSKGAYLK
jgi:hypothetical protein